MDKIKQTRNNLLLVLVFAFFSLIVFARQDQMGVLSKYPIASSYFTEFFAGFLGIIIAFTFERIQELKNEKQISDQVKQNLVTELKTNKETLDNLRHGHYQGSFLQLQTTSWDMFKEKLSFEEMDLYFQLGSLYHCFIEFNNNVNYCGKVGQAESRMKDEPAEMFREMINEIKEIIPKLEETS